MSSSGFYFGSLGKETGKASRESLLPDNPDMEKVEAFVEYVNRKAIEGGYLEGNTWY